MEVVFTVLTGIAIAALAAPILLLLLTLFVLVPLSILAPAPAMVAKTSLDCPITRRRVSVGFLTASDRERPTDVVSCSLFSGSVTCEKACLGLGTTAWAPSPMTPRYALLADGVTYR